MQLTWTGETHHVASVAPQPAPILAGALADSLLLLRPSAATGVSRGPGVTRATGQALRPPALPPLSVPHRRLPRARA